MCFPYFAVQHNISRGNRLNKMTYERMVVLTSVKNYDKFQNVKREMVISSKRLEKDEKMTGLGFFK